MACSGKTFRRGWGSGVAAAVLLLLAGCGGIPAGALQLPPESPANRQRQTRTFDGITEPALLAASAAVLQDLGFVLDESETGLGVIVASKRRSARNAGEIAGKVLLGLLALQGPPPWAEAQNIRVSIVTRPAGGEFPGRVLLRATFQRVVYDSAQRIILRQQLNDDELYRAFFARLAQGVFLEAQPL
jgi:hypothetical protein